jgi:hypothetical protein
MKVVSCFYWQEKFVKIINIATLKKLPSALPVPLQVPDFFLGVRRPTAYQYLPLFSRQTISSGKHAAE